MGGSNSKIENDEALRLCKERKRFIKQAIDSRYALAAAHVCYVQALKNVGVSLRRYAEAEVLIESSLSTSATELDKTPSHFSYPSPCPSQTADASESPLRESPITPPIPTISYMVAGGSTPLTVKVQPSSHSYVYEESVASPLPPPPPPLPHDLGSSWDYFDTNDEIDSFSFLATGGMDVNIENERMWKQFKGAMTDANDESQEGISKPETGQKACENGDHLSSSESVEERTSEMARRDDKELNSTSLSCEVLLEQSGSRGIVKVEKSLCTEQEDPSEFITHRAKDFLSSIKEIDNRFQRASDSGREVSRMLEVNKIRVRYLEENGSVSGFAFFDPLRRLRLVCCPAKPTLLSHEPHKKKVITWKRSTWSRSSSSQSPLAAKDDVDDSGSEFVEEFCMISGSHSSTLDRLYAWERKLYDEVKASESIRKEYDRKCDQLRYLFAKDYSTQVIDKTRAVVKDLHSRIRVAIYSVDSISKRVEKMRDEEMQPQLIELVQGLIRMWKSMLECHHAQYITISLAYHSKSAAMGTPRADAQRQILVQLQQEIECFGLSFANWINSLASYVGALNGWLQHCIQQPQERSKSRRPFSPRRVVAPPIFVLCRDWLTGINNLPSNELSNAIRVFLEELNCSISEKAELQRKQKLVKPNTGEEPEGNDNNDNNSTSSSNLSCIHSSLTKILDRLTKFSEASLKMYEDVRQKSEAAVTTYLNYKPVRY
ncbi:nitrate regulatory gene2 protein-like [Cucurbita moschata]|uniref:Nitrate regulatory gene2 protein-like n=1 Tax=Cucurbita moschata TaxID=3662 RepID=A0A6J1EU29_CUCMO|nr:nitrate regulatory gene2 protein-like [Cucurbita moschata]XP_022929315.1 nitrate regulatory gene2 protein-like [Cucurbita moschata]